MASRARTVLATAAAFVALSGAGGRAARAGTALLPDLQFRTGDLLSVGLVGFQEIGASGYGIVERVELGLGGSSIGAGFLKTDGDWRALGGIVGLQGRLVQTYGLTTWPVGTYAGPEVVFGNVLLRCTFGVMFDVENAENFHPQIGLGIGY